MSTSTTSPSINTLSAGRLPTWATWVILAAGLFIGIAVAVLLSGLPAAEFFVGQGEGKRLRTAMLAVGVVGGFCMFLIAQFAISASYEGRRRAADRTATSLVCGAFALALLPLISVVIEVVSKGMARIDVTFFTSSMRSVTGDMLGGAAHAMQGTLWVTLLATLISVPIGLLTAIYLVEYGRGSLARSITFFVDVMTGIPSIVAGLFAVTLFSMAVGIPKYQTGFVGSVALSVLMIPVVVRSAEELLRLVPNELREASYALGVPKWRTILKVVLPTALSGIISGVIIAIARIIGETAPLLVASGYTHSQNLNPFEGKMMTLPVFVYNSYANPGTNIEGSLNRAFAAALTLIIIVMLLNLGGRFIAAKFAPKIDRR